MADITSPIILDSTGQDIVTALGNVVSAITGPSAADVTYDGTTSGLSADDVQEAIDELASEKQDTLTFDATPTENSTNPVTSGGVYDALAVKSDITAIAPDESGNSTASQAYSVGEHFYKDGYFCTVTSAIASGGTLTKGTNYTEGDVSDALDDKMGILVDSSTSITNLDNIPVGCGYIKLDGSVSMTGSPFAGEYLCIGDPNGNRSLFMYRYATTTLYVCHRTSGTWTSWTSLTFS